MIACNSLILSRGETHKKNIGPLKFGPDRPKLGPKLGFLPFSDVWFVSFPENVIG